LRNEHEAIRESAARHLGRLRVGGEVRPGHVSEVVARLKAFLLKEESQRVRDAATKALERLEAQ
jgi:hypothetical protein